MVQRLGEGSVDIIQAVEVAISLCLCITDAHTIHRRPFYHKVGGVQAYPLSAHMSANLLALASAQAYIHSRDVALNHVVFLLRALPLCLVRCYIAHMRIFITRR